MKSLKSLLTIAVACASLGLASQARALLIGDDHELGFVNYGIPSGDADRTTYVNHLIGMSLGSTDSADGQDYTRSTHGFGSLSTAVFGLNGTSTTINIGTGLYSYLFAKYDGPNYGSEVWYIGDLSGTITIPAFGDQYGLSGWTLFGPGGSSQVPEGGSTLVLLGLALAAVAVGRTKIRFA